MHPAAPALRRFGRLRVGMGRIGVERIAAGVCGRAAAAPVRRGGVLPVRRQCAPGGRIVRARANSGFGSVPPVRGAGRACRASSVRPVAAALRKPAHGGRAARRATDRGRRDRKTNTGVRAGRWVWRDEIETQKRGAGMDDGAGRALMLRGGKSRRVQRAVVKRSSFTEARRARFAASWRSGGRCARTAGNWRRRATGRCG